MNAKMSGEALALATLSRLEEYAENAQIVGKTETCFYNLDSGRLSAYHKLGTLTERQHYEKTMVRAQSAGAIDLRWVGKPGEDAPIKSVSVIDVAKLSLFLGKEPYFDLVRDAARQTQPLEGQVPRLRWLVEEWKKKHRPRTFGPEKVADLLEASRVLVWVGEHPGQDIPVRRLSAAMFRDSKRIENLATALDLLSAVDLDGPARDTSDVLNELGLVRFPQPLMIAGPGRAELLDGSELKIPAPYVALDPGAIARIDQPGAYLLTVENLTTFNELARGRGGELKGTVVFVPGMPSPVLLAAFGRLYRAVGPALPLLHWGDIDLGGLRIAEKLQSVAPSGRLALYRMDPLQETVMEGRKPLSRSEIGEMRRISERCGFAIQFPDELQAIEQEALSVSQPIP